MSTHSVSNRRYPFDRRIEVTRVYRMDPQDYDGVTLSITDESERGTANHWGNFCHAYFTTLDELDQMIVDLVQARLEWSAEGD